MIGFINVFLPGTSGNAGSKYFSIERTKVEILKLFVNSIIDMSRFCKDGMYIYADLSGIDCTEDEIALFKRNVEASSYCHIRRLSTFQLNHKELYIDFFNHVIEKHGKDKKIFYSGNHDHLIANNFTSQSFADEFSSILSSNKTIVFPTHFPEFSGMESSPKKYLGYKKTKSPQMYRGRYLFSFMIASASFLKFCFSKNSNYAFIPRIDWPSACSRMNHICYFPSKEIFYHADGLSHIGLDNLISPPSDSWKLYNYQINLESSSLQATSKSQEKHAASILADKNISPILNTSHLLVMKILMTTSADSRMQLLASLRYFNSLVYHGLKLSPSIQKHSLNSKLFSSRLADSLNLLSESDIYLIYQRFKILIESKCR